MAQKVRIINSEDLVNNEPTHTDARYDRPQSSLLDRSEVKQWTVKEWPMLDEHDEESTNALGYPLDYFLKKRQREQEQAQAAEAKAQASVIEEEAPSEEREPSVTAEDLEQLRQAAETEGRESGYQAGYEAGFNEGKSKGHVEGVKQGFDEGHQQGVEQGFNEGREQGYSEGREQGLKDGEALINEQSLRFKTLADALANPLREADDEVATQVVRLAANLFSVLSGRELKADSEFLKKTVLKAISLLPEHESSAIKISLNPDDLALCEASIGRDYIEAKHWNLQADESLSCGDVVVGDGASEIKWKLQDRINSLIEDLLDANAQGERTE